MAGLQVGFANNIFDYHTIKTNPILTILFVLHVSLHRTSTHNISNVSHQA